MAQPKGKIKYGEGANFTDPNTSHYRMVALVGANKSVLEFGCASGYMSRVLHANGCRITGIELQRDAARIAAEHCERVIVADIGDENWAEQLGDSRFDVAVFGDVLEHLADPERALRRARDFLNTQGYVIVSLPNIAHGSVRLALLSGEFERSEVELVRWQGSGDIASAARANCYAVIPPDRERIEGGEWLPVLLR